MMPDEIKRVAEWLAPIIGLAISAVMLVKQIREPILSRVWHPVRRRFTTKGDILRMFSEAERKREMRADQDQRRHEELMAELKPAGKRSVRETIADLETAVEITTATVRATLDMQEVGVFHTDSHGQTTWVNGCYLRWTGRQMAEVMGYGWMNCIAEDERDDVREAWDGAVAERREFDMRYNLLTFDGGTFPVRCVARPLRRGNDVHRWQGEIRPTYVAAVKPA